MGAAVKVVRVELNGIPPTIFGIDRLIPASPYGEVGPPGNEMLQDAVSPGQV
jgi:hypothetical protein